MAFAGLAAKLPSSVSFEDGAVLPLAISTAASGLYTKDFLHLAYPKIDAKPTGKSFDTMAIDIFTVESGKLATAYHVENWMTPLQQLKA